MSARYIEAYLHGTRIGVLVELETVDDFATRTDEFQTLAKDLAMQIAAANPEFVGGPDLNNVISIADQSHLPQDADSSLLTQNFIKDPTKTVADRIRDAEVQLGVNIRVVRFVRFEAGAA